MLDPERRDPLGVWKRTRHVNHGREHLEVALEAAGVDEPSRHRSALTAVALRRPCERARWKASGSRSTPCMQLASGRRRCSAMGCEVASLLIQGRSAKAIASTLVLSPWTVQDHMKAIYEKTGVSDRYALAALAS